MTIVCLIQLGGHILKAILHLNRIKSAGTNADELAGQIVMGDNDLPCGDVITDMKDVHGVRGDMIALPLHGVYMAIQVNEGGRINRGFFNRFLLSPTQLAITVQKVKLFILDGRYTVCKADFMGKVNLQGGLDEKKRLIE